MNSDGSNVKTLTVPSPAIDAYPDWSPDGTKIIFVSDQDNPGSNQPHLYIMDADGSNVQRLTPGSEPDWTAFSYGVEPAGKLKSTWGKIKQKLFGK
jgi:Tol biopolymer transport system component